MQQVPRDAKALQKLTNILQNQDDLHNIKSKCMINKLLLIKLIWISFQVVKLHTQKQFNLLIPKCVRPGKIKDQDHAFFMNMQKLPDFANSENTSHRYFPLFKK